MIFWTLFISIAVLLFYFTLRDLVKALTNINDTLEITNNILDTLDDTMRSKP